MKKTIHQSAFVLLAVASLMTACQSAPEADKANTTDSQNAAALAGETYTIDTTSSTVAWVGTKPTGQHNGTFRIQQGVVSVAEGKLAGGNFTININSLNNVDMEGEQKGQLEGHLKGSDFFDTGRFPTARFEITRVEPFDSTQGKSVIANANYQISGNLTLKDSTKNVTFPALVTMSAGGVEAKANFNIDRTQWGMSYGNDKSLQDKFIRPEVNIQIDIKAKK